jgi:sensor histidine kinase regulating citrate/malate metabolism
MPRYFFHHLTTTLAATDDEGEEFATPEAAVAEARKIAQELAQNRSAAETRGWTLRVTDDTGAEIAVLTAENGVREKLS